MDKESIERVVRSAGYAAYFPVRRCYSAIAPQPTLRYVVARNGETTRKLGKFDEVSQMSEADLRKCIEARFAQPAKPTKKARSTR